MSVGSFAKTNKPTFRRGGITKNYSPRILIMDDDPLTCNVLKYTFKAIGYHVQTANCGASGLALFRKYIQCTDVIIIDLHLPVFSGDGIYQEIKKIKGNQKVVVVSSKVKYQELKRIVYDYDTMFIKKPFSLFEIVSICEVLVNN